MRKRIIIVSSVIIGLAIAFFVFNRDNQPEIGQSQSMETSDSQPLAAVESTESTATPAVASPAAGLYTEYSESKLASVTGTKILFFHASWCPQCRALEADIEKQGVPEGTTIFKVDYDNAQDLRKKYGVTLQTTVVKVDEQGNLISKFTPYQKPTLQNALGNL